MAKVFKFDAIGRDLFPGERQAAKAFVSKYESPPSKADAQKQMRTVVRGVLKASVRITSSSDMKASATVFAGQREKPASGTKIQLRAKKSSTSQFAAKRATKRSVKA
jgi:hypothetical protein